MLWIKTLHVLFVMSWMAGLFYLPRILINCVEARAAGEPTARLEGMAIRLFRFSSILAIIAIAFGLVLFLGYGIDGKWLHWKMALVVLLLIYHGVVGMMAKRVGKGALDGKATTLRWFNELPVLLVAAILILVIVKPV